MQSHVSIDIKNAIKGSINDRIAFYNSLIAQHRWKIMEHCTHIIEAFEQAVYDDKKKNEDVRLDDGLSGLYLRRYYNEVHEHEKEIPDGSDSKRL